jgi:hypothetical protein
VGGEADGMRVSAALGGGRVGPISVERFQKIYLGKNKNKKNRSRSDLMITHIYTNQTPTRFISYSYSTATQYSIPNFFISARAGSPDFLGRSSSFTIGRSNSSCACSRTFRPGLNHSQMLRLCHQVMALTFIQHFVHLSSHSSAQPRTQYRKAYRIRKRRRDIQIIRDGFESFRSSHPLRYTADRVENIF